MHFIIETKNGLIENVEEFTLVKRLESQSSQHSYSLIDKNDLNEFIKYTKSIDFKSSIPVGDIEFVSRYSDIVHDTSNIIPIEVPAILRKNKYLKREYNILKREELPKNGTYFLKSASNLKSFTYIGEISNIVNPNNNFLKDNYYVISEKVEILSEYRCFVLNDIIKGIQLYNGDFMEVLSKEDINLIKEMVREYSKDSSRPKAYTLDLALIKDRGVAILELHAHFSVGLYGYDNESLPYHYKFGYEWLVKCGNMYTKEGYLKFKNGYIGAVEDDVFWHYNLEHLKKKANPIVNSFLEEEALELKKFLEKED